MTEAEIYAALTRIFHDIFGDEGIGLGPETTAEDIPEWDSFNHINIIVAVETRFAIKFQTTELEALKNVGDMVRVIERKLGAAKPPPAAEAGAAEPPARAARSRSG